MANLCLIQQFRDDNVNLVPIPRGSGKRLTLPWKKYQYEPCNLEIAEDQDYAMICGESSNGLFALDIDNTSLSELFDIMGENILNETLVIQTGDGFHILFRSTSRLVKSKDISYKGKTIEIKGHGKYVVGASSKHYDDNGQFDQKYYEIISNVTTIKDIDPEPMFKKFVENKTELKLSEFESISITELEKGRWTQGSRYKNGFSFALKLFKKNISENVILSRLLKINETSLPPHNRAEIERQVSNAKKQHKENLENGFYDNIDQKKLSHNDISKIIMSEKSFVTLTHSDQLLTFDGVRYSEEKALNYVKERTDQLCPEQTKNFRHEVIEKIKVRTYKDIELFNNNPDELTLDNGILSLKSLVLRDHTPENLTTIQIPRQYQKPKYEIKEETMFEDLEKNLKGTLFWKYLKSCFTVNKTFDEKSFRTALEVLASIFVKKQIDSKAVMLLGDGENGKSVFIEYCQFLVGDENYSNVQLQQLSSDYRFHSAELKDKMLNSFTDLEETALKNSGQIKAIVDNEGLIAERKHGQPFQFNPFCRLLFSSNKFPKTFDQTQGFFRRWIILKWNRNFENDETKDPQLRNKLRENKDELNKVFSCMIHLSKKLLDNGLFSYSDNWKTIQKEWNQSADPVSHFIDSYCDEGDFDTSKRLMFSSYKNYCYDNGIKPLGMGQFSKAFAEFFDEDRTNSTRVWLGVKPKEPVQTTFQG